MAEMSEMVTFLYMRAFLDMTRGGRTGQPTAILAAVVGEEKAVSLVEAFLAQARARGLLD